MLVFLMPKNTGHLGAATARYASELLPTALRNNLNAFVQSIGGSLNRGNIAAYQTKIDSILESEIGKFDKEIGDALQRLCPRPSHLSEQDARRLIKKHSDNVKRAFCGTTVALALVNLEERFMWSVGVGDSTLGERV